MRRLLLILLAALVVPATAAAFARTQGDGSLAVRNANGRILVAARGIVLGRVDVGRVTIIDFNPDDATDPQVYGCDRQWTVDAKTVCQGTNIRFRFLNGRYRLQIVGRGIDLSAVGRGNASLLGAGTADDGAYQLGGAGAWTPIPSLIPASLSFGQPVPPTGP